MLNYDFIVFSFCDLSFSDVTFALYGFDFALYEVDLALLHFCILRFLDFSFPREVVEPALCIRMDRTFY